MPNPPSPWYGPQNGGKQHGRKPPKPPGSSEACCPMVAALHSAKRGKYRLARRYAAWSLRLIAARAWHAAGA